MVDTIRCILAKMSYMGIPKISKHNDGMNYILMVWHRATYHYQLELYEDGSIDSMYQSFTTNSLEVSTYPSIYNFQGVTR